MDVAAVYLDLYGRVPPLVQAAVAGLALDQLTRSPAPGTNHIAWLVWHMARVEDGHVAEVAERDQVWVTGDWGKQFGLASDPANNGYGHTAADVAAVKPVSPDVLLAYLDAVRAQTIPFLSGLSAADLDRIVDRAWDPPVTLGVRLVSIADDQLQHTGQAAYIRGLLAAMDGSTWSADG